MGCRRLLDFLLVCIQVSVYENSTIVVSAILIGLYHHKLYTRYEEKNTLKIYSFLAMKWYSIKIKPLKSTHNVAVRANVASK